MKRIFLGLILVGLFTSCNSSEKNKSLDMPSLEATPSDIEASSASSTSTLPSSYSTAEAVTNTSNLALNPPHGEPGHLCELEVGAPLPVNGALPQTIVESPTVRNTPISPSATSIINSPLNTAVPTGPKPKFNPAHGEPWHNCDLEVGAPLT